MKNIMLAIACAMLFTSFSFAGECNGTGCVKPRKVVTVTKSVVKETVRFPRRLVGTCTNNSCYSRTVTRVK